MENIQFIRQCTKHIEDVKRVEIGNVIYFPLEKGRRIKAWCNESAVCLEAIHNVSGKLDYVELPFANYFTKKRCSPGAPLWDQHIQGGKWWFAQYPHCLPTEIDLKMIASGVEQFIRLY